MKKKNNLTRALAIFLFMAAILAQNSHAQKTAAAVKANEPEKQAKKSVLQNYIDISALPMNERGKAFSDLSAEDKASIFRFQLAIQLVKRPNLTSGQKDLILEFLGTITPSFYDFGNNRSASQNKAMEMQSKALSFFTKQEVFEIFASLGGDKADIEPLTTYKNLSGFTQAQRRDAFVAASPEVRSFLWRLQLALYFAEHPDVNLEQRNVILEFSDLLSPDNYKINSKDPQWEAKVKAPSIAIFQRMSVALGKEEAAKLAARLGGPYIKPLNGTTAPTPESGDTACGCHRGDADACSTVCAGNICEYVSWGCGIAFFYSCNGTGCTNYEEQ